MYNDVLTSVARHHQVAAVACPVWSLETRCHTFGQPMNHHSRTLTARWIIPVDGPPLPHGTMTALGGKIAAVEPWGRTTADEDLGNCAILPGFVNAHTHLDLTGLHGLVPPGPDFTAWLRAVIQHRRTRLPEEVEHDIKAGITAALAEGTTLLGDISAGGVSWSALQDAPLRSVVFHELLGLSRPRARQAWQSARDWLADRPEGHVCQPGLSPHAPYSVRGSLFRAVFGGARRRGLPVAIHLGETLAELELLAHQRGPFVDFLSQLGVWDPDGLVPSIDELLRQSRGGARVLLIHGNYLTPAQLAAGDTVVYCPRTHAAFGHRPYPLQAFLEAGVRVALGTDSLASNPDLSVLEEARFIYRRYPEIAPAEVLRLATLNGAEALGWADVTGSLTPGKSADWLALTLAEEAGDPCEQVLAAGTRPRRVLIAGREMLGSFCHRME
jgi:aminodeoxyfutalosine deaminase